jgi:tetratricopeptide (TPR) repeat protein
MAQDSNYILKDGLNLVNIADALYNESPDDKAQSAYIDAIYFIIGCNKNHTNKLEPIYEELDFWVKHYITDSEVARTVSKKIQFVKLLIICLTKILEILKLTNDEDKIDVLYLKCISFFQTVLPNNCVSSIENGKLIGDFIPFEGSEEIFLGHAYMKLLIDHAITLQIQETNHTTSLVNLDIVESFYLTNKMNLDLKYAQGCICRGIVLMSLASYNDVLETLTTALSVRLTHLHSGDVEIAAIHRLIAEYYLVTYNYNDAFNSITKCLEIEQNKYIEGNDNYYLLTTSFHVKARILLGLAQYKESYDLSLFILRKRESRYGLRHIEVSIIRLLIADVLQAQGFAIKAYKSYNYAHIIITDCIAEHSYNCGNYRSLSLNRYFAYSVYCLAANTEARGLYQEAIILYDSAVELRINIKNGLPTIASIKSTSMVSKKDNNCDLDIAESQIGLARIYCYLGRYTEATELLGQAGSTICKILGNESLKVSDCLLGIADVFKSKGNYKSAKSQYNQCLNLRSKQLEGNHPLICQVLHSASENLRIPGLFKEAATLCDKSLSGRVQVLGQFHPDTSLTIGLRCRIMCDLNDAEQALPLYYTSFHNLLDRLGDSHPHILNFLLDIGECLRLSGSYKDSEEILRDALPLLRKIFKSTTALGGSIDDIIRFNLGIRRVDTDDMEEGLTPDNVLSSIFFFPSMISNEEIKENSEPLSLSVGQYFGHIGLLLLDQGRAELAREAFSKHAIPLLKQAVGKKHPIVIMADGILGRIMNTLARGLGDIKINRAITKLSKYEEIQFPPTHPWIKLLNAPLVVSKVVVLRKEELEEDIKKTGRALKEHELKVENIEEWEKQQVLRNICLQKKESEDRAYGYRRVAEEKQKKIDEEIRHQAKIIEIGIEYRNVSQQCLTEISYMIQLDYEKEQRLLGQGNLLSQFKSSNNSIISIDSTESQKRIVLLQKKIELHNVVKIKKIKKSKVFARLYKDQIIQDPPYVYEKPVIDNIDNSNETDDDIFSYARVGDVRSLVRLLDEDPKLALAADWGGTSVLHMAMILRNFECVEKLIEYGALVEKADSINRTPLDYLKDLKKVEEIKEFDEKLKNNYKEVIPYRTQRFNHFRDSCYYGKMEQVKVILTSIIFIYYLYLYFILYIF